MEEDYINQQILDVSYRLLLNTNWKLYWHIIYNHFASKGFYSDTP